MDISKSSLVSYSPGSKANRPSVPRLDFSSIEQQRRKANQKIDYGKINIKTEYEIKKEKELLLKSKQKKLEKPTRAQEMSSGAKNNTSIKKEAKSNKKEHQSNRTEENCDANTPLKEMDIGDDDSFGPTSPQQPVKELPK